MTKTDYKKIKKLLDKYQIPYDTGDYYPSDDKRVCYQLELIPVILFFDSDKKLIAVS